MIRKKIIIIFIFIIMFIPFTVNAYNNYTYNESLEEVNQYIKTFPDYKKYILQDDLKFICEANNSCISDTIFFLGGFLNISEFKNAGGKISYLYKYGDNYFTHKIDDDNYYISDNSNGYDIVLDPSDKYGVKIAEYINHKTRISGLGTYSNPFVFIPSGIFLTVELNGGYSPQFENDKVYECDNNTDFFITSNPTKNGQVFTNWTLEGTDATLDGMTIHLHEDDALLSANYRDPIVTIDLNGGTSSQYENGTKLQLRQNETITINNPIPSNSDYVFAKWELSDNSSKIKDTIFTMGNTDLTLKAIYIQKVTVFSIAGGYTFPVVGSGNYLLEVWGASSKSLSNANIDYRCGYGAYARGEIYLDELFHPNLYVYVGGMGKALDRTYQGKSAIVEGGFNGGGAAMRKAKQDYYFSSGGGATHIAYGDNDRGVLSNYESYKNEIVIVAGGGGGASIDANTHDYSTLGGHAGGFTASKLCKINVNYCISGPTQTSGGTSSYPGTFGQGASRYSDPGSGGGGGGWYGGATFRDNGGGTGGTSYIGNEDLINKSMYCYDCKENISEHSYSVKCTNKVAKAECTKKDTGYAKITYLEE